MNGLINLRRLTTITIATKENDAYIVFSDGKHRMGMSQENLEKAEETLQIIQGILEFGSGFYRINQELEEVRSYKLKTE